MRDLLTFLAILVIVALTAALAVPPLVDWRAHRGLVDAAIARAIGTEVASDGALEVRLLPSPRLKMDRLRLGPGAPDAVSLDAMFVRAEMALAPLLSGEIRFRDARIGRAEFKLPTGAGGDWRVSRGLIADASAGRAFAFEDLGIAQLLVTTTEPATGRTDQFYAETVRMQAGSLRGPWRINGRVEATPFEAALGEIGPDLAATLKLGAGGGGGSRLDLDARVELAPDGPDALRPRLAGAARLSRPPAQRPADGPVLPFAITSTVTAAGRSVALAGVTVEAGAGAATVRLTGEGRYRADEGRLSLSLAGRRLDLPGFLAGQGGASAILPGLPDGPDVPIDVALRLDGLGVGGDEDLSRIELNLRLAERRLRVLRMSFAAPGGARVTGDGELAVAGGVLGDGRIAIEAQDGERLARFLDDVGVAFPPGLLDARPLSASADVALSAPVLSLRNLRLAQGETVLSGSLRHLAGEGGARSRIDAQLALQGLDLARLPARNPLFEAARRADLGLVLDARNVAYGGVRGGRVTARLESEGQAIAIERLEIAGLAGADATLSGRIAPDGAGRIEGRLKAARAAPLVDLFGPAMLGGVVRLVPNVLRDGPIDVAVRAERAGTGPDVGLRIVLDGTAAGGTLAASTISRDGRVTSGTARLATDRAGVWFGTDRAALRRPASVDVAATRDAAGRLAMTVSGDVAGLRIATPRPLALSDEGALLEGEADLSAADAAPVLGLLGDAGAAGPLPLALRIGITRAEPLRLSISGRVAGESIEAELDAPSPASLGGRLALSRLSLPWLSGALALGPTGGSASGALWSPTRFSSWTAPPLGGSVAIAAATVDLGRGLVGRDAAFTLLTSPDGFSVRDGGMELAGGRASGGFAMSRQGGLASLIGEGRLENVLLPGWIGPPLVAGRLSGTVRFGSSGESAAAIVASLGGAGSVELAGVEIRAADPAGVERAASRALRSDDALAGSRLAARLAEEIDRGPLTAGPFSASASLVGGALRVTPLRAEAGAGAWLGSATVDLRTMTLDARGSLQARALPRGWSGPAPSIGLAWAGPLARPVRSLDPGPLVNGLATIVLQRELDRIEVFELDAAERSRLNSRTELDRQRRLAAEEAARQAKLREEAAERARLQAERARLETERLRLEAERARETAAPPPTAPPTRPPVDIRPPVQVEEGG